MGISMPKTLMSTVAKLKPKIQNHELVLAMLRLAKAMDL